MQVYHLQVKNRRCCVTVSLGQDAGRSLAAPSRSALSLNSIQGLLCLCAIASLSAVIFKIKGVLQKISEKRNTYDAALLLVLNCRSKQTGNEGHWAYNVSFVHPYLPALTKVMT